MARGPLLARGGFFWALSAPPLELLSCRPGFFVVFLRWGRRKTTRPPPSAGIRAGWGFAHPSRPRPPGGEARPLGCVFRWARRLFWPRLLLGFRCLPHPRLYFNPLRGAFCAKSQQNKFLFCCVFLQSARRPCGRSLSPRGSKWQGIFAALCAVLLRSPYEKRRQNPCFVAFFCGSALILGTPPFLSDCARGLPASALLLYHIIPHLSMLVLIPLLCRQDTLCCRASPKGKS